MRTRELKVGQVYFIRFEDPDYSKDLHYVGPAKLTRIDGIGDVHEFELPSCVKDEDKRGWFGSRNIHGKMKTRYSFK